MARVLVVEDEEEVRKLTALILQRAGHEVQTAAGAESAIQLLRSEAFDLVLTDVDMPGTDGHSLACWIADHYPVCRVCLMTAFDPLRFVRKIGAPANAEARLRTRSGYRQNPAPVRPGPLSGEQAPTV